MMRCCLKWLFKHSFVKKWSEVHVFEIATPRRQSQHKQNKSLVVKWYNVKTFPCLGHYMDTLSLLGCEFFYSCDGGVSFIMSLHSKQILCRMGFQYSFFTNWQWQGFSVEKSHHHIYFFFCFYFLKVLIKRERILVNYIINDINIVMKDKSKLTI